MKIFFNFIKTIFKFLLIIFFILIIYTLLLAYQNNASIDDTIQYISTSIKSKIYKTQLNPNNTTNTIISNYSNNSSLTNIYSNKRLYYYEQLDDNGKLIYNYLKQNINNLKKDNFTIDFSTKFDTLLHENTGQYKLNKAFQSALDAFFYDHPELFYIDLTKMSLTIKYTSIASKTTYKVSLSPKESNNYLCDEFATENQVNDAIAIIEQITTQLLNNINSDSDYEKALEIHDSLVSLLEYDTSSESKSHTIYGAFIDKKAVCEGYAKAYKYLLDKLGIECILVSGIGTNSSGSSENHMWNYIKLNDNWYGVDITWDDPITKGNSNSKIIRHEFFCKGINDFVKSHNYDGKFSELGMLFSIPTLSTKNYK